MSKYIFYENHPLWGHCFISKKHADRIIKSVYHGVGKNKISKFDTLFWFAIEIARVIISRHDTDSFHFNEAFKLISRIAGVLRPINKAYGIEFLKPRKAQIKQQMLGNQKLHANQKEKRKIPPHQVGSNKLQRLTAPQEKTIYSNKELSKDATPSISSIFEKSVVDDKAPSLLNEESSNTEVPTNDIPLDSCLLSKVSKTRINEAVIENAKHNPHLSNIEHSHKEQEKTLSIEEDISGLRRKKSNAPKRKRTRNVNGDEHRNILKVLLDLLEKTTTKDLLHKHVVMNDWNVSINEINLFELIQKEPGSYKFRTGHCLKQYFSTQIKKKHGSDDFLNRFLPQLENEYPDERIMLLRKLLESYRLRQRCHKKVFNSTEEAGCTETVIQKKTVVSFKKQEETNIIIGVLKLLEENHDGKKLVRCLKSNWNLKVMGKTLRDYITSMAGSYSGRLSKSFTSKWSRMVRVPDELFKKHEKTIKNFPPETQKKLEELVSNWK